MSTRLLVIASVFALASCSGGSKGGPNEPITSGAGLTIQLSDRPVPAPSIDGLADVAGQPITWASLKGKIVLVNFWATWCGPCRAEIPMLIALQDRYRDHLVILGLSIDEGMAPAEVKKFADDLSVNYPIAMAGPAIDKAFGGITAVPSTFVVNKSGQIVQKHLGLLDPRMTEHEVRALAGLETDATVEYVKDTGQVLVANAAYATEIPGVDFTGLSSKQKTDALKRLNTELCGCGCGLTLAQCRIHDSSCDVSLPAARALVQALHGNAPATPTGAERR